LFGSPLAHFEKLKASPLDQIFFSWRLKDSTLFYLVSGFPRQPHLWRILSLSLFRVASSLGSRFKVRIADWRYFGTREFQSLEALVDVYLKAKDPIEKAK